jgi:GT2 family glycosyltransferase
MLVRPLSDTAVGIAGGRILSRQPCNRVEKFGEKIHDHKMAITGYKHPYVITMNWAARRSFIEEMGCFDESFLRGSDSEFSLRVEQAGFKFAYADAAVVYHRNEKNLPGLFSEGYIHGFYSNKILKTHREFLAKHGHRRFYRKSYADIFASFKAMFSGKRRAEALCHFTFNVGKKTGKMFGSIRFAHVDL